MAVRGREKLETEIEQDHRDIAIAAGWFVAKVMQAYPTGFPDRFYAKGGRVVLMEWKRVHSNPTPQQELRHRQLRDAGVEVHVVSSIARANEILGII